MPGPALYGGIAGGLEGFTRAYDLILRRREAEDEERHRRALEGEARSERARRIQQGETAQDKEDFLAQLPFFGPNDPIPEELQQLGRRSGLGATLEQREPRLPSTQFMPAGPAIRGAGPEALPMPIGRGAAVPPTTQPMPIGRGAAVPPVPMGGGLGGERPTSGLMDGDYMPEDIRRQYQFGPPDPSTMYDDVFGGPLATATPPELPTMARLPQAGQAAGTYRRLTGAERASQEKEQQTQRLTAQQRQAQLAIAQHFLSNPATAHVGQAMLAQITGLEVKPEDLRPKDKPPVRGVPVQTLGPGNTRITTFVDPTTSKPIEGGQTYPVPPPDRPPTNRLDSGMTPGQELTAVQGLNQRYRVNTQTAQIISQQHQMMQDAWARIASGKAMDLNAAGQQILVTFQKILDPTSVVRESEYARSQDGQALIARLEGMAARIAQGGPGLTKQSLQEFVSATKTLADRAQRFQVQERDRIGRIANRYGLDPTLIFTDDQRALGTPPPEGAAGTVPRRGVYNPQTGEVEYR